MIRLLCTDVDGVMTDNRLHIAASGELFKTFHARDGWALKEILPDHGIIPAVITGRNTDIVRYRCRELGVSIVLCGRNDKDAALQEIANNNNLTMDQIAYIGDDLNDLPAIAIAGLSGCPADAIDAVKKAVTYVCKTKGGDGALREFAEWVVEQNTEAEDG